MRRGAACVPSTGDDCTKVKIPFLSQFLSTNLLITAAEHAARRFSGE